VSARSRNWKCPVCHGQQWPLVVIEGIEDKYHRGRPRTAYMKCEKCAQVQVIDEDPPPIRRKTTLDD